jgi:hypothetical protein
VVFGPTGRESLAQGLPWEMSSNVTSPEGAIGFREWFLGYLISGRPFRASADKP